MTEQTEKFSEEEKEILSRFVTNTTSNIFVLRNLPEVVKGALFSRYSRSSMGLRALLLKEFIQKKDAAFEEIVKGSDKEQLLAIQKAQSFYDRILDGFGDDSIGELGGAHLALENISMLAAKAIEDCRIGGSPLEKSTRYIYFDQKVDEEYLFYKEPVLMASAFRSLYFDTCNKLFDTYSKLIPHLTSLIQEKFPKESHITEAAYTAALRGKVLDCLRGLLPASALTNVGIFGNGRFFDGMLHKLLCHNLAEMEEMGKEAFEELSKMIPSFVRRSDPQSKYQKSYAQFSEQMAADLQLLTTSHAKEFVEEVESGVSLIDYDAEAVVKVAAALLFPSSHTSLEELQHYCRQAPQEEIVRILDAASLSRENRRHKSPRALELCFFTFEIVADFGIYRDLQRHRMLTQERQLLNCSYGYYIPEEILGTEMEGEYKTAMEEAKRAYDTIAEDLPEEAQYVVPMAYNMHWYFHINLRALQWLCELRSAPQGHSNYRYIAQEMAKEVCQKFPLFERFFKFVDFDGEVLGRIKQEEKSRKKK